MTESRVNHQLAIEYVPLEQLDTYPGNARVGDVDAIADSMDENGIFDAIVVQRSTGYVLDGNHRYLSMQQRGDEKAPVIYVDVDDDRAKRIVLVANRLNDVATYDDKALVNLLESLPDLDGTGYDDDALTALLDGLNDLDVLGDEDAPESADEAPDVSETTISRPGDVWQLGRHRVICGDSTSGSVLAELFGKDRADAMWTDPPYGVEYVGKTADALTIKNDGSGGLGALLQGAFVGALAMLKPGAPAYVCSPQGPLIAQFQESFVKAGFIWRQNLVWVKNAFALGHSDYHYQHEPILYGFTPGGSGILGRGGDNWHGDNAAATVFEVNKPSASRDHPTMKPVELIQPMLRNSLRRGGIVFDPFAGSGSTLIAAHYSGGRAFVIELDPRYVDVICRRYQTLTEELPVRDGVAVDFLPEDD